MNVPDSNVITMDRQKWMSLSSPEKYSNMNNWFRSANCHESFIDVQINRTRLTNLPDILHWAIFFLRQQYAVGLEPDDDNMFDVLNNAQIILDSFNNDSHNSSIARASLGSPSAATSNRFGTRYRSRFDFSDDNDDFPDFTEDDPNLSSKDGDEIPDMEPDLVLDDIPDDLDLPISLNIP